MTNTEPSLAEAQVVLGISADASPAQVASAFRRLARGVHPDVNEDRDAEPRFDALVAAYRIALPAAEGGGGSTDASGSQPPQHPAGATSAPSGRTVHTAHGAMVGTSGTMVWEAGRPVLFVSDAAHTPPTRPARRPR